MYLTAPLPNHLHTSLLPSLPKLYFYFTVYLPCLIPYTWLLSFDHMDYIDEIEFSNAEVGMVLRHALVPHCFKILAKILYQTETH